MADPVDLVVLGGGAAGLATAWYAGRRGFSVLVVERAQRTGGLASSLEVDGEVVDLGSHRLHSSIDPEILADLRGPLAVDLQWRPRRGRIRLHDRWLAFPLRAPDLALHTSPRFAGRVAVDLVTRPLRARQAAVDSFDGEVRRRLGPAVADEFYGPYARKLWGVPAEQLSAELFRRRVSASSPSVLLRRLAGAGPPRGFWYPVRGFGAIVDGLAAGIDAQGGTVAVGCDVERITPRLGGSTVHLAGGRRIQATTVVSTIPAAGLLPLLDERPASLPLASRGAVLVYLSVPRRVYTPFDAHYFPGPETVVSRLSEPRNYRDSPDDPADHSVICAEVPATPGDALWNADDALLAERVAVELVAQGLPHPTARMVHVERRTHVYPIYRIGHERRQALIDAAVDRVPGVVALGRQALFAHDNTHHALAMGAALAGCLRPDATVDLHVWRAHRRAFADHVVED